jgi:hypothetical protein
MNIFDKNFSQTKRLSLKEFVNQKMLFSTKNSIFKIFLKLKNLKPHHLTKVSFKTSNFKKFLELLNIYQEKNILNLKKEKFKDFSKNRFRFLNIIDLIFLFYTELSNNFR